MSDGLRRPGRPQLSAPALAVGRFSSAACVLLAFEPGDVLRPRGPGRAGQGLPRSGSRAYERCGWTSWRAARPPASLPGVGVGAWREGLQCPAFSSESRDHDRDISHLR